MTYLICAIVLSFGLPPSIRPPALGPPGSAATGDGSSEFVEPTSLRQTPPPPSPPTPEPEKPEPEKPSDDPWELTPDEKLSQVIRNHLKEIVGGKTAYDDVMLTVTYDDNIEPYSEPFGKNDPKYLDYTGRTTRLRGKTCCFAGNTMGSLHLPAVFEGPITVRARVNFDLVEKNPTFLLRIHSSEDEFLATDLGVHIWQKALKKKPRIRAATEELYRDTPQKWLDRTRALDLKIVYDPEKKTVACFHGFRQVQEIKLDKAVTGGRVGFTWQACKFVVEEIEIYGKLDRAWAAKRLAKQLEKP